MIGDLEARVTLREPDSLPGQLPLGRIDHLFVAHDDAPMGYWRKPDGWVILSQYGDNGTEKKLDRDFVRLGKYGTYSSSAIAQDKDPLLPLVLKDGLRELPAEQIKNLGWHRVPDRTAKRSHREVHAMVQATMQRQGCSREEAVAVVMPQTQGYDMTDHHCVPCNNRPFPTSAALQNHTTVMHKDALQSESIGKAVAAAHGAATGASASNEALLALIAQQGDVIAELKARLDAAEAKGEPKKNGKAADG